MGGSVSSGKNNDELVDNLVEGGLIKSQQVERVFRAVDRGAYYLPDFRENAYRDLAWREGFFHLSAPCIYSRVMEALDLQSGHAFLNIGSGTGYFSTMAGLIIGSNGLNHNVELHRELVDYANKKLIEFVKHSAQFDDFDFCVPQFVNGNVLNLVVEQQMISYDRIYVGVGVSDEHEQFMKSLLKINGVLVMPLNDSLVKIKRLGQDVWETNVIMTCSFASLVKNTEETATQRITLPKPKPLSLQEICRFCIRNQIRRVIESEQPGFYQVKRFKSTFNSEFVPKGLEEGDEEEDEDDNEDESDHRGDDEDDSNDTGSSSNTRNDNENIFDNIHQLFLPHRSSSNNSRGNHIQNQLRLMIYGRLLDSNNNNPFAIELQRNPNRVNDDHEAEEEEEDDESEDQQSETGNSNNNSYFGNVTREISLTEESEVAARRPILRSIVESGEELRISTLTSSVDVNEPHPSEERRQQHLLAVASKSQPFGKQSETIPIPLKITATLNEHQNNDDSMGRSSESGFRSASLSSSASSPFQAKAASNASSSNSDTETGHCNHTATMPAETRLLLRKRNYSCGLDIYSESITAGDVDDEAADDFSSYYPAKKADLTKDTVEQAEEATSPKVVIRESDEGCLSDDGGDVSLSGVKLSAEFQAVRDQLKSAEQPSSSVNLMQSKINELPVSKILKNFLSYHRKA